MPRIEDFDSDEDMSGVEHVFEQSTTPPISEKPLTSKANLMSGMVDDDISDYDFDEDSDDSDLEIYGKVKPLAEPTRSRSMADTNDDEDIDHLGPGQELGSPTMMLEEDRPKTSNYYQSEDELNGEPSGVRQLGEEEREESWLEPGEDESNAQAEGDIAEEEEKLTTDEVVKREDDVSIKSEDDTESIHFGEGADEEDSTINVQPSSEVTPTAGLLAPAGASGAYCYGVGHGALPWLVDAPTDVQTVLSKWYDVHGKHPPPCAGWPAPQYMRVSTSGKTAIWLHASGEHLMPSMYQLPDLIDARGHPTRRILVVQGATKGPYIVAHTGGAGLDGVPNGTYAGTRYRIWLGVDSSDADGFEPGRASVWKGFAHNLRDPQKTHSHKSLSQIKAKSLKRGSSQPSVPKGKVGTLTASIPEKLRSQLEAWMKKHGRSYPPCTTKFPEARLHQNASGGVATWWHVSGEQLRARGHPIDAATEVVGDTSQQKVLIVEGATAGPYLVKYYKSVNSTEAISYRIWEGVSYGDERGFERGCSVFKVFGNVVPTRQDFNTWQQTAIGDSRRSLSTGNQRSGLSHHERAAGAITAKNLKGDDRAELRPRSSIAKPSKYVPSKTSEYKRADYPHKRKRDEYEEEDGESLLNSFMSPAAEKIPQPPKVSSRELVDHIKNNVVLLFFPQSAGAPRVRLLGSCDSVQKLFAQALAGDVFADGGGSGTKVLALTFGGGQNKSRSLVEDDDQDFDDLIAALEVVDCWVMEDGALQGSLTVEVRAK